MMQFCRPISLRFSLSVSKKERHLLDFRKTSIWVIPESFRPIATSGKFRLHSSSPFGLGYLDGVIKLAHDAG
jgi:hypothetical protein